MTYLRKFVSTFVFSAGLAFAQQPGSAQQPPAAQSGVYPTQAEVPQNILQDYQYVYKGFLENGYSPQQSMHSAAAALMASCQNGMGISAKVTLFAEIVPYFAQSPIVPLRRLFYRNFVIDRNGVVRPKGLVDDPLLPRVISTLVCKANGRGAADVVTALSASYGQLMATGTIVDSTYAALAAAYAMP